MLLEGLRRDALHAARTLSRTPGLTGAAVLTLALGIGAVTTIYSVVRNVVLDPFPYSQPERLVNVSLRDPSGRSLGGLFPAEEFLDYEEQTTVFEDVVGTRLQPGVYGTSDMGAARLNVAWMTPNAFAFFGVPALLGRTFGTGDTAPGASPVAVVSHGAWAREFGADPTILGRSLVLNGQPWTVVGVMPSRFARYTADVWLPSVLERTDDPRSYTATRAFLARLRPGVTPRQAETQLAVVAARRATEHPRAHPPHARVVVERRIDFVVRDFRPVVYTLFGAVGLLLVIACCNVANMLLARATVREKEISIRLAMGAGRRDIIRQMLVEAALLALGGLLLGAGFAYAGVGALARFMPTLGIPAEAELRVDEPILAFAAVVAAFATLGVGLFPALLQNARSGVMAGVTNAGRNSTAGRGHARMRNSLVVAQVALSVVHQMAHAIRRQIQAANPQVALGFPETFEHYLMRAFYERPRFNVLVLGVLACVGAILAVLGVYGVMAYTVSQRTREIAIRMALGGTQSHVLRMMLSLGVGLVTVGLVIGAAASVAANRLLVSQLWETSPHDPLTFVVVLAGILTTGAVACLVPARRAVRVKPMVALRNE